MNTKLELISLLKGECLYRWTDIDDHHIMLPMTMTKTSKIDTSICRINGAFKDWYSNSWSYEGWDE